MGVMATAIAIKMLFQNKPGLIINEEGIFENSNIFSIGQIRWKDISGFRVMKIQRHNFLYVMLKNPEKYINSCGPLKSRLLRASLKVSPSPIAISSTSLNVNFEEMVEIVKNEFENYKRNC
jgi:hypothetical protein